MQTFEAYAALVKELEAIRQLPAEELLARVGAPPAERVLDLSGQRVEIQLSVAWRDNARTSVLVTGHARGPSTWRTEHLQETITVDVGTRAFEA